MPREGYAPASGNLDNCPDDRASVSVLRLEAAPIGKRHPRDDSSPGDQTAFVAPVDREVGPMVKTAK
jgi:hypothetical protein